MTELLEREAAIDTLRRRLRGAAAHGHVALVAGEAGIGKTSVLRALADGWAAQGPLWWGACDALQTPLPLAPLLDIAREARPRFAARLDGPRPALFEAVLDDLRLAAAPVLVVIEDAHWADDATLDLLKFLGRRIERTHALLAVSFRDDEVTAAHPLRRVLGELPTAALTRIELPRLSPQAVEMLARGAQRPAAGVYEVTHGNPFFVTEVLRDAGSTVPRTVQDVVLARAARLPPPAQELLRLAAVVPGRIERWLVDELLAPALADVEACLAGGLLVADGSHLAFRHELGRVAVESSLSPPAAQALHARVLAALAAEGRDTAPARLVHHAARAGDTAAVTRHAPMAAEQAHGRGSFREAEALWRIARRLGRPVDDEERRRWLQAHLRSAWVVGRDDELFVIVAELERLARARGDLAEAALMLAQRSQLLIGRLRHREARAAMDEALALVEPLPASAVKARVWLLEAWLLMLDRDWADSMRRAERAMALAQSLGDEQLIGRVRNTRSVAMLFVDYPAACAEQLALLDEYRKRGELDRVASVLGTLGSGSGELMHLAAAEGWLRELLALCRAHELDASWDYGAAWLALVRVWRGGWEEAGRLATEVLATPAVPDMSRLMALLALARLRLRRGDPGVGAALDEALALAEPSGTLQRVAPTRAVRAEAALARGDGAAAAAEVAAALPLAAAKGHPWFIGELAYWGWRAGSIDAPPSGCAEPYALEMAGRWREAAEAWLKLDCPYERARALAAGDAEAQQQALAIFDRLGAAPAAEALRRRLREAGVRGVARGARESTRAHPCGLTAAEMKVLRLMAEGLRNAEIAARVHRSVRTVDHHVAAVLAKLGTASRQEAVRRAEREGWLAPAGQSGQSGRAI